MANSILPKPQLLLSGAFVIRALGLYGPRYECGDCGATMFVRYDSGLCPRCFNREKAADSSATEVLYDFEQLGTEDLASE